MPLQRTTFRGGSEGSGFGHECTFSENVNLEKGASITGTISGVGNVDIEGSLAVAGALSVAGKTTIAGDTDITGDTTITGNTIINGNLVINGTLTLQLGGASYTLAGVFVEPDTGQIAVRAVAV
tara:strand:- start:823 stop:1194 length:372 start_codon:yes stop_codon:yes gene_type:complete